MKHLVTLVGMFFALVAGCADRIETSVAPAKPETPALAEAALAGGCRWECPKCTPAMQVCPKYACHLVCNGHNACASDADCATFSNYCNGCACDAVTVDAYPKDRCPNPVECFRDPCGDRAAVCNQATHTCELTAQPVSL